MHQCTKHFCFTNAAVLIAECVVQFRCGNLLHWQVQLADHVHIVFDIAVAIDAVLVKSRTQWAPDVIGEWTRATRAVCCVSPVLDLAGQCLGVVQSADGFFFWTRRHAFTGNLFRHTDFVKSRIQFGNDRIKSNCFAFNHHFVFTLGLVPQRINNFLHLTEFVERKFFVVAWATSRLEQDRLDVCVQVWVVGLELLHKLCRVDITRAKAVVAQDVACGVDQVNVAVLGHLRIGLKDLGKAINSLVNFLACVDCLERQLIVQQLILFGLCGFSSFASFGCLDAFFRCAGFCQRVVTRTDLADHLVAND